jgi:hypothetical protein
MGHVSFYVRCASTAPSRAYREPGAMTLGLRTHWKPPGAPRCKKGCIAVNPGLNTFPGRNRFPYGWQGGDNPSSTRCSAGADGTH